MRYKKLKRSDRSEASRTRDGANAALATLPLPTEAREGSSGLVGSTCARQLLTASTTTNGNLAVYNDAAAFCCAKPVRCATVLKVGDTGSCAIPATSDMCWLPGFLRTTSRWPQCPSVLWGMAYKSCVAVGRHDSASDG